MLDIRYIRENADAVTENARRRGSEIDVARLLELDGVVREHQKQLDELRTERNENAAGLKQEADKRSDTAKALIAKGKELKKKIAALEVELGPVQQELTALLKAMPNLTHPDVPEGPDESGNIVVRKVGQLPSFEFKPKPHWELGERLGIIDNERASEVSGARFTYLKGGAAMLEFALMQYVLGIVTSEKRLAEVAKKAGLTVSAKPFIPVFPPVFIRPEIMDEMGRLEPKEDRFYVKSDDLYLIGSAEHTLGPLHRGDTFDEAELPVRYIGFSTSFRREAGSYGKDTRGIIRMHQFDKLELESFGVAECSEAEQDLLVAIQEEIVSGLALPYQVVQICTGDMGDPDYRQIDIETWMAGQGGYRETHTSDLMTDYQSRRLGIKVKRGKNKEFAHMNDATACAMNRIIIAILENNQRADGSVAIPEALHPYLFGQTEILAA